MDKYIRLIQKELIIQPQLNKLQQNLVDIYEIYCIMRELSGC